jgi:hypothetical protein
VNDITVKRSLEYFDSSSTPDLQEILAAIVYFSDNFHVYSQEYGYVLHLIIVVAGALHLVEFYT